jgi:hypothetical protein
LKVKQLLVCCASVHLCCASVLCICASVHLCICASVHLCRCAAVHLCSCAVHLCVWHAIYCACRPEEMRLSMCCMVRCTFDNVSH